MKVILLRDVPKIGKKYEIKNVADGYALNMLIPKNAAKIATDAEVKKIEALKALERAEQKIHDDLLIKTLAEIDGKSVVFKAKASDKGHLFAQIHPDEIVKAIKDSTSATLIDSLIPVVHIKETGTHKLVIKALGKSATINLVVEAL